MVSIKSIFETQGYENGIKHNISGTGIRLADGSKYLPYCSAKVLIFSDLHNFFNIFFITFKLKISVKSVKKVMNITTCQGGASYHGCDNKRLSEALKKILNKFFNHREDPSFLWVIALARKNHP